MAWQFRPLALVAALLLGGCGAFNDIQTLWGGESQAEKSQRVATEQRSPSRCRSRR